MNESAGSSRLCTDTRVEIPDIVGMIESKLDRMSKFSARAGLNSEVHLLKPPPNRHFR